MRKDQHYIVKSSLEKVFAALTLVDASVSSIERYNSVTQYSPKEREPFDALSDRFSRAVEICIKFFRSYDLYLYGERSETTRDLLNKMEKLDLVSSVQCWMEMRDVRNRIVHEYLPEEIQEIYDIIMGEYAIELQNFESKIKKIATTF